MRSRKKTVAQLTDFPELFGGFYWGAFPVEQNRDVITPEIIENRNRFARDYNIHKVSRSRLPACRCDMLDHPEAYLVKGGGLVFVCSNYHGGPPAGLGMREIYPVYATMCESYARKFETAQVYKKTIKSI